MKASSRLHGLPPLVGPHTRLLILGSFPGVASLQARQYYAHPYNQFWKILQALWPGLPMGTDYAQRCQWLLERGLGLWDVYASCERAGSLDSAIRNAVINDFAALKAQCPQLRLIAHNGGESFKHAKLVRASFLSDAGPPQVAKAPKGLTTAALSLPAQTGTGGRGAASRGDASSAAHEVASVGAPYLHFPLVKLPSTSPANASWSFERKLAAWRDVMRQAGLP